MIHETITCDECGVEKKKTNHWWNVEAGHWDRSADLQLLISRMVDPGRSATHLCGALCVVKRVSQFLEGKL